MRLPISARWPAPPAPEATPLPPIAAPRTAEERQALIDAAKGLLPEQPAVSEPIETPDALEPPAGAERQLPAPAAAEDDGSERPDATIEFGPETDTSAILLDPGSLRDADEVRALSDRVADAAAEFRAAAMDPDTRLADTMVEWSWKEAATGLRGPWPWWRTPEPTPEPEPAPAASQSSASTLFSAADFTGAGQTVVVIDDGYSSFYDQSATIAEYDFAGFFNDPSAQTFGLTSHGSWVAQTVTAEASGVEIVHLKVFPESGEGASLFDIEEALQAVIDNADAYDIAAVNLSLGFGNATEETMSLLSDEFAALDELGIVSVAAAGNAGETYDDGVNVIAADPNVIGVSAVDDAGAFAEFSQTSESLTDIAAPGVDIGVETTWGAELEVSGTSFAAPTVAGIAARLDEAALTVIGEDLTDEEVLEILQASGTAVDDPAEADGYVVADGDAAVEYFLANAEDYGDLLIV